MPRPHEHLRAAGIRLALEVDDEDVRVECTRLASQLVARGGKLVGLVPAGDAVGIPTIALQLGRALADLTGSPIGVIDAAGGWPLALGDRDSTASTPSLFTASWLADHLAVLTPRSFDIGALLLQLDAALRDEAAVFGMLLVDMTGFERMGQHLAAMAAVDAVIVVARAGRTSEAVLRRWMRDVPPERNLGVLLTSA